jgi:hypothetical protein
LFVTDPENEKRQPGTGAAGVSKENAMKRHHNVLSRIVIILQINANVTVDYRQRGGAVRL